MNEDREQDRVPKQQAKQKRPPDWQPDLNPNQRGGQKIGQQSDARINEEWTAFHLRKRGLDGGAVNDASLDQAQDVRDDDRPIGESTARPEKTIE